MNDPVNVEDVHVVVSFANLEGKRQMTCVSFLSGVFKNLSNFSHAFTDSEIFFFKKNGVQSVTMVSRIPLMKTRSRRYHGEGMVPALNAFYSIFRMVRTLQTAGIWSKKPAPAPYCAEWGRERPSFNWEEVSFACFTEK